MRGKVAVREFYLLDGGITPAYAGKRCRTSRAARSSWDQPRMCGEKKKVQKMQAGPRGSPPHVRGKEVHVRRWQADSGITPAYAGKSRRCCPPGFPHWDHPRVCGEKTQIGQVVHPDWGSPPRMRGKEVGVSGDGLQLGITPAYAGKSSPGLSDMHANGDHPRMCGEKARTLIVEDEPQGSPPHVRGKAPQGSGSSRARGITPACAGKRAEIR